MSRTHIPDALRQRVAAAAGRRCGYCQAQEIFVGYPLHIDHIIPEARGGPSSEDNLWLSCFVCNNAKGVKMFELDPVTGSRMRLFNPRTELWDEHFAWSEDGAHVVGRSPTGRATVTALQLNAPFRIHTRQRWVAVGWHPPRESPR
jgi:hypothetical protein